MSELAAPVERAERTRFDSIESLLAGLAEDMRSYDRLKAEGEKLEDARQALAPSVGGLDLEVFAGAYPRDTIFSVMKLHIIEHRLDELALEVGALSSQGQNASFDFYFRKVRIESVDPTRYNLARLSGPDNSLTYNGHTNRAKEGQISKIIYNPYEGGALYIRKSWGMVYGAYPLIDREAGYLPAYSITEI